MKTLMYLGPVLSTRSLQKRISRPARVCSANCGHRYSISDKDTCRACGAPIEQVTKNDTVYRPIALENAPVGSELWHPNSLSGTKTTLWLPKHFGANLAVPTSMLLKAPKELTLHEVTPSLLLQLYELFNVDAEFFLKEEMEAFNKAFPTLAQDVAHQFDVQAEVAYGAVVYWLLRDDHTPTAVNKISVKALADANS